MGHAMNGPSFSCRPTVPRRFGRQKAEPVSIAHLLGAPALWRSGPGSLLPPRPLRISLVPMSTQAEPLPSCPPWSTLTQASVGLPMSILPSLPALCLYEGSTWPLALAAWSSSFLPYILYVQLPFCLQAFPIPLTLAHAAPPFQQASFTLGLQHLPSPIHPKKIAGSSDIGNTSHLGHTVDISQTSYTAWAFGRHGRPTGCLGGQTHPYQASLGQH